MTTYTWLAAAAASIWHTRGSHRNQRGEGVISAAIVVLIMALIGASMWFAFNKIWSDTEDKTERHVSQIGS